MSEDKVETGCTSVLGIIACGPVVFVLIFVLLALVLFLPLSLLGLGLPDWLFWIVAIIAAVVTVLVIIQIASGQVRERREKELIRKAEVRRAKKELGEE